MARLARVHVLSDAAILAHPKGKAQHHQPRLGAPKVPPERAVMAVAERLHAQVAAGGNAEAARSALSATVEESTTHQKRPAGTRPLVCVRGR